MNNKDNIYQEFNKLAKKRGLKRMFLHAHSIEFTLPSLNQHIKVIAPLDPDLEAAIKSFQKEGSHAHR